jgi:2-isopropylmalate synthase
MNGKSFTGKGLSTDIIEASVKAYINAVNRFVEYNGVDVINSLLG